ncbi:MAG TPA: ribosome maturation factor RimP [Acidimicrobiales bacterium]|nr:ribosome maturation factor RimP [Acidimicrobiales bacterium]
MDDQVDDELSDLLASTVGPLDLELVDIERRSNAVRVVVDRAGGVDLEAIAAATRAVSAALDSHDPFPGQRYTLEVSSPGVERRLRTARHFQSAVGEKVSVRTLAGGQGERRVTGRLAGADAEGFVLSADDLPGGERRFSYDEIERARTVFEWGTSSRPAPPKGRPPSQGARSARAAGTKTAGSKKVATS